MTGDDFYLLSIDHLLSEEPTPARYRTSIGRAYYAAFHRARALLLSIGIALPKGSECHSKLVFILGSSGDADVSVAASKLAALRKSRNDADYDLARHETENFERAELEMRTAKDIIACIDECLTGGTKAILHPALRKYASEVLRLSMT
jgi:uncharacterized protein (UPF0332 family)